MSANSVRSSKSASAARNANDTNYEAATELYKILCKIAHIGRGSSSATLILGLTCKAKELGTARKLRHAASTNNQ
jgi:hypothetical protein